MKIPILSAKPGNSIVKFVNKHGVVKYKAHGNITTTGMPPTLDLMREIEEYQERNYLLADKLIDIIFRKRKI